MPLTASPVRGYQDWQRLENWDEPELYSRALGPMSGGVENSGVLDVSRFAYLGGFDQVTVGDVIVSISWWQDFAATVLSGSRQYQLAGELGVAMQLRLPNLGPFAEVQWTQIGVTVPNHLAQLMATNRAHPLEMIPKLPVLMNQISVAVAANTATPFYPSDYYSGPLRLNTFADVAGCFVVLQWMDNSGTWRNIGNSNGLVANSWTEVNLVAPPGAWRILATTGVNAAHIWATCLPTLTGAL